MDTALWIALAVLLVSPYLYRIWAAAGSLRTKWRNLSIYQREERQNKGLCIKCGYDLRGNVSGVCPECGRKIAEAK